MTRSELIRGLDNEYAAQREADAAEDLRRRAEAEAACPGLRELLEQRQQLIYGSIYGILEHRGVQDQLPKKMEALNLAVSRTLREGGLPENWLDPVAKCPLCRDSGYIGEPVRRRCSCFERELNRRLYAQLAVRENAGASFEQFDLNVFPDTPLEGKRISQRRLMQVIMEQCRAWADGWPDVAQQDLLLIGLSGLGKTYLMHCIAKRLIERGRDVLMISAFRYLQVAREAYFGGDPQELESLLKADVLLLDDLGSEPMLANVTISQLLNLINERRGAGKGTVISTNLTDDELRERYTERIASRLLDRHVCLTMHFEGEDVRQR